MDLILWRHAEAEDSDGTLPDHQRRLTPRGEKQARQIARWLRRRLPPRTRILVSPTERTLQTVQALALAHAAEARLAPGATAKDLLALAGWPAGPGAVLLVGHQPALGRVAALLLGGVEADWAIKKGGLWWFASRSRNAEAQVVLRAVLSPELLAG